MRKNKKHINKEQSKNKLVTAIVTLELKVLAHCCSLAEFINVLHHNNVHISIVQLVRWLNSKGYINIDEDAKSQLTHKSEHEQLLCEKNSVTTKGDGSPIRYSYVMVTTKGQCYFLNKFINQGIG